VNPEVFRVVKTCPHTGARAGELVTPHGVVPTPAFIPVGSQAAVKALTPEELREIGVSIILANTFHVYLRPGLEVVERFGGLRRFMGWAGPLVTDSGGYQVFSLARVRKVSDAGVEFLSPVDGSPVFLSPELSVEIQEAIGSDIMMTFDQPVAYGEREERLRTALERTHRWAEICLRSWRRRDRLLFGIVQGGVAPELRAASARFFASLDFPGYAIGGLSLGEPEAEMWRMVELTVGLLPPHKPRHLMGVGSPEQLVEGVARGIDLFDCALPTRVARNGGLFTRYGRRHIRSAEFKFREGPIDEGCPCFTCRSFPAAYLHHLFKAGELLAPRLATIHNLTFIIRLMEEMRRAILEDRFPEFRNEFHSRYRPTDARARLEQKHRWLERWGLTSGDGGDDADLIPGL